MNLRIFFVAFIVLLSLLVSCLPVHAAANPAIVEFCPDTYLADEPDEYFVLAAPGSLDGYLVTDGEGTLAFPAGAVVSEKGTVTVAQEGLAFFTVHGYYPDYEIVDTSPVPQMSRTHSFRLANKGDEITLLFGSTVIDSVAWPGDVQTREGQIHFRDKDGRWDPRVLMLGGTRLSSATFSKVSGRAFVSPDSSRPELMRAIHEAQKSIFLNVYEITDTEVTEALCTAHSHGIHIRVLVEGRPVGGISADEYAVLSRLNQCGVDVKQVGGAGAAHTPYRYNHAKYLVVDDRCVFVTSENIKFHSFPPAGTGGNRGWGVYLCEPSLVNYMTDVFLQDFSSPSSIHIPSFSEGSSNSEDVGESYTYVPVFSSIAFTDADVIPVISPDTSFELVSLIDRATRTLEIEQAYISQNKGEWTEIMQHVFDAARRGVFVRILLDSSWFNTVNANDNDEMVDHIRRIAQEEHLPLEAKLIDLRALNLLKVHNKGVIVDGAEVFVGSINWNENSPTFNREVGVIIRHLEVARYFKDVFESDWSSLPLQSQASVPGPVAATDGGVGILRLCGLVVAGIIILIVYIWRHHR